MGTKKRPEKRKPTGKPSGRREPIPQAHGGALVPGAGGGPQPGSGRPSNELRDYCVGLLGDQTVRDQVRAILSDHRHPAFATMWKAVADRAFGKPKEHVEHTGTLSLAALAAVAFTGARDDG